MPRAGAALLIGQRRHFIEHGEPLTFRDAPVTGVVDRYANTSPSTRYKLGDETEDSGIIQLQAATIAALPDDSPPDSGEILTDASGVSMRITEVKSLGPLGWELKYESRL